MKDDTVMLRLRTARPADPEAGDHEALLARIVARPGDPRTAGSVHEPSGRLRGERARRWASPRLVAGATGVVAASAIAATLLVGAAASPPPAYAVTRLHDGSVAVKINRTSGIAGANRKLAAMGIHERVLAVGADQSTPTCVAEGSAPKPGPGVVISVSGPDAGNGGNTGAVRTVTATSGNTGAGSPGTSGGWHVVVCPS